jgi:hypothetical protein
LLRECSMHAEMRYCNKISVMTSEEKNLEYMDVDGWKFLREDRTLCKTLVTFANLHGACSLAIK